MTEPAIVAPVSRFLAVTDADRSIAFYRDVLGFEIRPLQEAYGVPAVAEAVRGPARIQLGTNDGASDSTGEQRSRGSAILFFETDDVAAMREFVIARGGKPTDLEKVNWIKMRMFELRDPDGHTLWFGQSYHVPSPQAAERIPAGPGQLRRIMPTLPLSDVDAGVAFYRDVLGFSINYAQHDVGVMDRDEVTIVLIARTEKHKGIGSCYLYVRDADALHAEFVASGANVHGEPVSRPWGLREFQVLDPEGNQITFGQTFE